MTTNLICHRIVPMADRNVCSRLVRINTRLTRRIAFSVVVTGPGRSHQRFVSASAPCRTTRVDCHRQREQRKQAERHAPAAQELSVVAAGVGEGEAGQSTGTHDLAMNAGLNQATTSPAWAERRLRPVKMLSRPSASIPPKNSHVASDDWTADQADARGRC